MPMREKVPPPLTDSQRELVQDNLKLVHEWIRRSPWVSRVWGDDATSMALYWACKIVTRYDPDKGCWSTFLWNSLWGLFQSASKRNRSVTPSVSIDSLMHMEGPGDNGDGLFVPDYLGVEDRDPEVRRFEVQEMLSELPPALREVIELRYLHGLTLREVANKVGVTKSRIEQRERMALEWLRGTPRLGWDGQPLRGEPRRKGKAPRKNPPRGLFTNEKRRPDTPEQLEIEARRMVQELAEAGGELHTFHLRDRARVNSTIMRGVLAGHVSGWFAKEGVTWRLTEDGWKVATERM